MDVMLLVVDATKGMQAQTMECVVIGEAVMAKGASVIVVLNKVIHGRRTPLFPRFELVFVIYCTVLPHDCVRNALVLVHLDLATRHF